MRLARPDVSIERMPRIGTRLRDPPLWQRRSHPSSHAQIPERHVPLTIQAALYIAGSIRANRGATSDLVFCAHARFGKQSLETKQHGEHEADSTPLSHSTHLAPSLIT